MSKVLEPQAHTYVPDDNPYTPSQRRLKAASIISKYKNLQQQDRDDIVNHVGTVVPIEELKQRINRLPIDEQAKDDLWATWWAPQSDKPDTPPVPATGTDTTPFSSVAGVQGALAQVPGVLKDSSKAVAEAVTGTHSGKIAPATVGMGDVKALPPPPSDTPPVILNSRQRQRLQQQQSPPSLPPSVREALPPAPEKSAAELASYLTQSKANLDKARSSLNVSDKTSVDAFNKQLTEHNVLVDNYERLYGKKAFPSSMEPVLGEAPQDFVTRMRSQERVAYKNLGLGKGVEARSPVAQTARELVSRAATAGASAVSGLTAGIVDPMAGEIRLPEWMYTAVGQKPEAVDRKWKGIGEALAEKGIPVPQDTWQAVANNAASFAAQGETWGALSRGLEPIFGTATATGTTGILRRIEQTIGVGAIWGAMEPNDPGQTGKTRGEVIADSVAIATALHGVAEGVGQAVKFRLINKLKGELGEFLYNRAPGKFDSPEAAAKYADQVVDENIAASGGPLEVDTNRVQYARQRASQLPQLPEFVSEGTAPTAGELPPGPAEASGPPIAPEGLAPSPVAMEPPPPPLNPLSGLVGYSGTHGVRTDGSTVPLNPIQLNILKGYAKEFSGADILALQKIAAPVSTPPVAATPPPLGEAPVSPGIQATMSEPPEAVTVRDGEVADKIPMNPETVQNAPEANAKPIGTLEVPQVIKADAGTKELGPRWTTGEHDLSDFGEDWMPVAYLDGQNPEDANAVIGRKGDEYRVETRDGNTLGPFESQEMAAAAAEGAVKQRTVEAPPKALGEKPKAELPAAPKPAPQEKVPTSTPPRFTGGERVTADEGTGWVRQVSGSDVKLTLDNGTVTKWIPMKRLTAVTETGVPETAATEVPGETSPNIVTTEEPKAEVPVPQNEPESETSVAHEKSKPPMESLAIRVRDAIKAGQALDNPTLTGWANEAFGGTRGEGKYDPKMAYDAAEAGINMAIREPGVVDFNDVPGTLKRLRELVSRMPTQADRTAEQTQLQQFSTPPEEAFAATLAGAIQPGMSVLEPSGGTGNIAVMAQASGGTVTVNEISSRRQQILEMLGFKVHSVDALHLNSLLDPSVRPDIVVMNPPFSSTSKTQNNKTEYGAKHVTEALARVKEGGRVVAIVGGGMAHDKPGFSDWWNTLEQKYNVRANIGISGKHYAKYGTGFDNQIIVIDKTGPTPGSTRSERLSNILRGTDLSPEQAIEILTPLSKEDVRGRIEQAAGTAPKPKSRGGKTSQESIQPESGTERPAITPADSPPPALGSGQHPTSTAGPDAKPGGMAPVAGTGGPPPSLTSGRTPSGHAGPGLAAPPQTEGSSAVGGTSSMADVGQSERGRSGESGLENLPPEKLAEKLEIEGSSSEVGQTEDDVFDKYVVRKARFKDAVKHPANIVESATMASVEPPEVNYTPKIPAEVIKGGKLSDVQMEAITYAGQRHQVMLPDGKRAAYTISDGTGVGKGREIAGIFYDNLQHGKKRGVWFTVTSQLSVDAKRDMDGVGLPMELIKHNDTAMSDALPDKDGVLFTTYGLSRYDWTKGRPRYQQLIDWLGPDFDGVIVLDEAHKAKNAVSTNVGGQPDAKTGSQIGAMILELSKALPNARFTYVSATSATVPRNMAYMDRLGLWGAGAPFHNFMDFLSAMDSGGMGAMEMLARDLKAIGAYIGRSISYKGVEYNTITHTLTPQETESYDKIANFWNEISQAFDAAMKNSGQPRGAGNQISQFYSAQQRFFLQYMTSLQMPQLIKSVEKDLADGKSVVINIYNTNEQQTKGKVAQAIADGVDLDELDFTPREILVDLLNKYFPVHEYEDVTDPATGVTTSVLVRDDDGNPVINAENAAKKEELIDRLSDFAMPDNPLDAMVNHFGPSKVSEISGRQKRLEGGKYVRRKIEGVPIKQRDEMEVKRFQDGTTRIAIITAKAAAGISLHSDMGAKNKQRRSFYAMQLSWSADTQMQAFGRVHRSFQDSAPVINLMKTNLRGQERLVNTTASRLASLGAITKGGRETLGGGLFDVQDITDQYGSAALQQTYRQVIRDNIKGITAGPQLAQRMGIINADGNVRDQDLQDVPKFLNRIMALPVKEQNTVFDAFFDNYLVAVQAAKAAGTFDVGVKKIKANNIRLEGKPETVYTHPESGAKTELVHLKGEIPLHPIDWEKSKAEHISPNGYWENNKSGRLYAVRVRQIDSGGIDVTMTAPNGNRHSVEAYGMSDLERTHKQIDEKVAKSRWTAEFEKSPSSETKDIHLLTGAIYPIYNKIMGDGAIERTSIGRAVLKDGSSYVGLQIQSNEMTGLKQRLGIGTPLGKADGRQIYDLVKGGSIIELDNGWKIRMTKIHSEPRMEVDTRGSSNRDEMKNHGTIEEQIEYKRRYFVPLSEDGPKVINSILKLHSAVKDETSKDAASSPGTMSMKGPGNAAPQDSPPPPLSGKDKGGSYRMESPPPPLSAGFTPAGPKAETKEPIGKREILADLSRRLNIPLRTGRFRDRALGIFKVRANVSRTKAALDIAVSAHELGHGINKILWGTTGTTGQTINWKPLKPFAHELEPIATQPRSGQSSLPEGFAEFVRMYLTEPSKAEQKAPEFFKFFEKELASAPELESALKDAQKNIQRWLTQPANARILSHISFGDEKALRSEGWDRFYESIVDQFEPVARLMNPNTPLDVDEDPYKLLRLFAGSGAKGTRALEYNTFDPDTLIKEGKSLKDILKPVSERLNDLRVYLIAARAKELHSRGLTSGFDSDDINEEYTRLHDKFEPIAKELYGYQKWLLDYLVRRGVITKASALKMDPAMREYVPFYRLWEASTGEGAQASGLKQTARYADLYSPIMKFKGSGRMVVDPLESIIRNTYAFINLAERNRIGNALVNLANKTDGAGWLVEAVPSKNKPVTFNLGQLRDQLVGKGVDLDDVDLDDMATVFVSDVRGSRKDNVLSVLVNGERKLFQVHPEIYRALEVLDDEKDVGILVKLLAYPARLQRLGFTTASDVFPIRNIPRDIFDATMQSNYGFQPWRDPIIGLANVLGKTDLYKEWMSSGAAGAALVSMDRTHLQKKLEDMMRSPLGYAFHHPVETIRIFSEISEEMTRVGAYAAAKRKGASIPEAAFESRDITTDFALRGSRTRALNMMRAFWNANLQGTAKFLKTHKEHPIRSFLRGILGITLVSALVYMMNRKNPEYEELRRGNMSWLGDLFWLIPTGDLPIKLPWQDKIGHFLPIPKPHLWGIMYGSIPERFMEWADKKDPGALDGLYNTLKDQIPTPTDNYIPSITATTPIIENWANRSIFSGRPIVPQRLMKLSPENRYEYYTSDFSKLNAEWLGKLGIHLSPMELDNAYFGYSGGMGRLIMDVVDRPLGSLSGEPAKPAETWSDKPVLRALSVRFPSGNLDSIQKFYNRLNELEMRYADIRQGRTKANPLTAQEFMELKQLQNASDILSAQQKQVQSIIWDKKLTPDEKRDHLDAVELKVLNVARKAISITTGKDKPEILPTRTEVKKLYTPLSKPPGLPAPPGP